MQEFYESISAGARRLYLAQGVRFGSAAVIAQGRQTLAAGDKHVTALQEFGFGQSDLGRLRASLNHLLNTSGDRENLRATGRESTQRRRTAIQSARRARTQARTLLSNCLLELREAGNQVAVVAIEAALSQTVGISGSGPTVLDDQLAVLAKALAQEAVKTLADTRGGARTAAAVEAAVANLRAALADPRRANATASQTERLSVLDGVVVELCRSASRAARSAAKEPGQPALAQAFELSALYGPHGAGGTPPPSTPQPSTPQA